MSMSSNIEVRIFSWYHLVNSSSVTPRVTRSWSVPIQSVGRNERAFFSSSSVYPMGLAEAWLSAISRLATGCRSGDHSDDSFSGIPNLRKFLSELAPVLHLFISSFGQFSKKTSESLSFSSFEWGNWGIYFTSRRWKNGLKNRLLITRFIVPEKIANYPRIIITDESLNISRLRPFPDLMKGEILSFISVEVQQWSQRFAERLMDMEFSAKKCFLSSTRLTNIIW